MNKPMKNGAFNMGLVIDYAKLIELQANEETTPKVRGDITKCKVYSKSKKVGVSKNDKC